MGPRRWRLGLPVSLCETAQRSMPPFAKPAIKFSNADRKLLPSPNGLCCAPLVPVRSAHCLTKPPRALPLRFAVPRVGKAPRRSWKSENRLGSRKWSEEMRVADASGLVYAGAVPAAHAMLVERIWHSIPPLIREANVKSKAPLGSTFTSGPLILTFARECAETGYER